MFNPVMMVRKQYHQFCSFLAARHINLIAKLLTMKRIWLTGGRMWMLEGAV